MPTIPAPTTCPNLVGKFINCPSSPPSVTLDSSVYSNAAEIISILLILGLIALVIFMTLMVFMLTRD